MSAGKVIVPGSVALWCFLTTPAWADDTTDLQSLLSETVVVGASRSAEISSTAPAVTTTLTAQDIRRYGIHSIDEAIDFLSLGAATSSTLRSADIGSRGVLIPRDQGSHFLLLINGHAVNEALYGAARFERGAGIPIELVDRIEVILGPGSVLYGSSAMLGVINVITKSARDFKGTHVVVESEVLKSWRGAAGGGYEFPLFGQTAKVALELEYYQQDGRLRVGPQDEGISVYTQKPWAFSPHGTPTGIWGGTARNSYYTRVPSGLLTFRLENFELDLRASTYKRSTPFNRDYIQPESDFDDPDNYEIDRSVYFDARYKLPVSAVTTMMTRLYGDTFDYRRFGDVSAAGPACTFDVTTCRKSTFGASRWGGAEIQATFDWFKGGDFVTMLGADARARYVLTQLDMHNADNGAVIASTDGVLRAPDRVFAAYAQQTWSPARGLALNGGGRFDFDERFGQRFSPRLAASVRSWQGGTLKVIYSEAFRAPSWQESASAAGNRIPAEGLRPETVRSIEAALDQKLGAHRLLFGVFRSWWNDLVELHTLSVDEVREAQSRGLLPFLVLTGSQYRNVSAIDNYGFNAGYEGTFADNRVSFGINVTGAIARRSTTTGTEAPLVVAPQFFGNARIAYQISENWPTVALASRFFGARLSDRAIEGGFAPTPIAPPLVEVRATVTGAIPFVKGLSYRLSANYAFAERGPYVIGPHQIGYRPAIGGGDGIVQQAELIPIERFRTTVGLQYEF
jgi:outer membrane receptor for ferrienterochelin and colicins